MRTCSFLVGLLLIGSTVEGGELARMQQLALENRPVIQRYAAGVERSEQDVIIARGGYYPSVDISYVANSLDDSSFSENSENSVATGKVSWNLFSGFRDKYGLISAEQLRDVEQYRLVGTEQDIQLAVALNYLNVFDRKANLRVSEDAFKTLEQLYKDGENRFAVGLIGKNELLQFRVDYDNADITMKAAQASLDTSVNSLSREVGAQVSLGELDFAEFDILPGQLDEMEYRQKMRTTRSEIKALESLIEAGAAQVQAAYADYYPQVDLIGSYRNYDDDFINGSGNDSEDELRGQVMLSMNLFRGFTKEARTSRAKLEKRQLQYDLDELYRTLDNTLSNLFIDYRISLANVEVARRSIEQAEENLRITRLKYEEGLQRVSDLLDAITNLSRARANEVAVVRTVYLNYFRIQRMVDGF